MMAVVIYSMYHVKPLRGGAAVNEAEVEQARVGGRKCYHVLDPPSGRHGISRTSDAPTTFAPMGALHL